MQVLTESGYLEEKVYPVHLGDTWMSPLIKFLSQKILSENSAKERRVQRKVAQYALRDDELYKRSYLGQWLRCIIAKEGERVLCDIHQGLCGANVGHRMLAKKALLLGYFWPTSSKMPRS